MAGFDRSAPGSGMMVNKQAPGTVLYIASYTYIILTNLGIVCFIIGGPFRSR